MTAPAADIHAFPILGEPLPVELANTRYTGGGQLVDFLASPQHIAAWFAAAPCAHVLDPPRTLRADRADVIRRLRDAVHRTLTGSVDRTPIDGRDLAILNRCADRAVRRAHVERADGTGLRSTVRYTDGPFDVLVAQIAVESIEFLTGPQCASLRRCAHPDCTMFFVQHHRARRFCHESCAHRSRQARYYASVTASARGSERSERTKATSVRHDR